MDKMDNILDYFMGTKAYTLFLLNYFYDDVRDDFILDERNIVAAKVGFISNILLGIKEGLVSQDENGSYSRLYENVLEESVLDIATKKDDGYVIDGYYFKLINKTLTGNQYAYISTNKDDDPSSTFTLLKGDDSNLFGGLTISDTKPENGKNYLTLCIGDKIPADSKIKFSRESLNMVNIDCVELK